MYEYISLHLGIKKAPLSYVICAVIDPPVSATDPPYAVPDSRYTSPQEEAIACSPIKVPSVALVYHADFHVDNKAVWELVSSLCRDQDC